MKENSGKQNNIKKSNKNTLIIVCIIIVAIIFTVIFMICNHHTKFEKAKHDAMTFANTITTQFLSDGLYNSNEPYHTYYLYDSELFRANYKCPINGKEYDFSNSLGESSYVNIRSSKKEYRVFSKLLCGKYSIEYSYYTDFNSPVQSYSYKIKKEKNR